MKAIVCEQYGSPDVLKYQDVAQPVPQAGEVLVKVRAASLNAVDWRIMRASPFLIRPMTGGILKPRYPILGADVAGVVEAVGSGVTRFKPGDEVFGDLSTCERGALAEYVCAREDVLALKPPRATFEQAAAVPLAAMTALQALRDEGEVGPGKKVLIYGASGGVGTFAVQIAKALGAEVTAVCSTAKMDMVRELGADHVIDYTKEDFVRDGQQYDVILAVNGSRSIFDYRRALRPGGIYVMAGGTMGQIFTAMLLGPLLSRVGSRKFRTRTGEPTAEDMAVIAEMMDSGKIVPVIERRYPLSEAAEALRYLEQGHARGKIVITMDEVTGR